MSSPVLPCLPALQVPPYILSRLQRLVDAADIKERKRRARTLALLAALLQLAAARPVLKLLPPRPAKVGHLAEGGAAEPAPTSNQLRRHNQVDLEHTLLTAAPWAMSS